MKKIIELIDSHAELLLWFFLIANAFVLVVSAFRGFELIYLLNVISALACAKGLSNIYKEK